MEIFSERRPFTASSVPVHHQVLSFSGKSVPALIVGPMDVPRCQAIEEAVAAIDCGRCCDLDAIAPAPGAAVAIERAVVLFNRAQQRKRLAVNLRR